MRNVKLMLVGLLLTIVSGCGAPDAELVVYSARNEPLIKPMFDRFTEETGIKVVFVTDKAEVLMQRLQAEENNTPADVLLTVDAGNLWWATQNDLLQPLQSPRIAGSDFPFVPVRSSILRSVRTPGC